MTPHQAKVESILEQLKAKDIIKKHLRYAIHQDVPVTYHVYHNWPGQFPTSVVEVEAVVSSDDRIGGSFRWPTDDHWVRVIGARFDIMDEEINRSRGTATQIILARLHACGIEMQARVPQYVEVADVMEAK